MARRYYPEYLRPARKDSPLAPWDKLDDHTKHEITARVQRAEKGLWAARGPDRNVPEETIFHVCRLEPELIEECRAEG